MSEILLEVKNLSVHFGGLRAVDGVSFSVANGEILGLLGPNGAGKTTCFNALSGVYKATAGEIFLSGRKVNGQPPYRMAQIGIGRTFQIVRPFANLSVLENVMVPLGGNPYRGNFFRSLAAYQKKHVIDNALEILTWVGLEKSARDKAASLPIGSLRRLEIARALALRPKLLLLDESFSGLRHSEIVQIESLVRGVRERGISVLLIEHNMKVAMALSDRVVVFDRGKKLAEGLPSVIAANPSVIEAYLGGSDYGKSDDVA